MAATAAKSGFGTLLKVGDGGGPEAFTTVAEIVDVSPGDQTLETDDATNMESPGGYRERIATLLDAGPVNMSLNFIEGDTTHAGLRTDMNAKTLRNFEILTPGAAYKWSFSAFVTNIGDTTPMGGKMVTAVTLTPSGQKTFAVV